MHENKWWGGQMINSNRPFLPRPCPSPFSFSHTHHLPILCQIHSIMMFWGCWFFFYHKGPVKSRGMFRWKWNQMALNVKTMEPQPQMFWISTCLELHSDAVARSYVWYGWSSSHEAGSTIRTTQGLVLSGLWVGQTAELITDLLNKSLWADTLLC